MSEYREKYMKYKNRYLDLKKGKSLKQFGGGETIVGNIDDIADKLSKPFLILNDKEKQERNKLIDKYLESIEIDKNEKQIYEAALKNLTYDDPVFVNNEYKVLIKELYDRTFRGYDNLKSSNDLSEGMKSKEYNALSQIYKTLKDMDTYFQVEDLEKLKEQISNLLKNFNTLFEEKEKEEQDKLEKEQTDVLEKTEDYLKKQNEIQKKEYEQDEINKKLEKTNEQIEETQDEFNDKKLKELTLQEILEELKGSNAEKIMLEIKQIKQDEDDDKELIKILQTDLTIKDIQELSIDQIIDLIENKLKQANEITEEVDDRLEQLKDQGSELEEKHDDKQDLIIVSKEKLLETGKNLEIEINEVNDQKNVLNEVRDDATKVLSEDENVNNFLLGKYKEDENFELIRQFLTQSGGARKISKEEWLKKYLN